MSYVKTNWATSDIVTAAKLNKIEEGISDIASRPSQGALIVTYNNSSYQSTVTLAEMVSAYNTGRPILIIRIDSQNHDYAELVLSIIHVDELEDLSVGKIIYTYDNTYCAYEPDGYPWQE